MVQGGAGDLNCDVLTALRAVAGVLSAVLLAYVLANHEEILECVDTKE